MTNATLMEPILSADAGDSLSPAAPALARGGMDYALVVKAHEMVHVGTWVVKVNAVGSGFDDVVWSDEMFRMLGFEPQSFAPSFASFMASVHLDDRERLGAVITTAVEKRTSYQFDYRLATTDGALKVLHSAASVELDALGNITCILGTCTDITERYREQQALKESEVRLRAVFEQSSVGMLVASSDGVMLRVNNSYARFLGYSVADLEGKVGTDYLHPLDKPAGVARIAGDPTEQSPVVERRFIRRDGQTVWGKVTVTRLHLDGTPDAIMAIIEDIDQHKRANRALELQTEILRGMLDHLPVMVLRLDSTGRLIYSNCEAVRVFGWTKGGAPADIISAAFPDQKQAEHARRVLSAGKGEWVDLEPRAEDGRVVPSAWAGITLSDGESLIIGQDLSERRKMQQSLAQSQKLEAIGQLAGGIAHDFNNLLTVISAGASFVQDAATDNPGIAADAQDILTACARAASLTRQLLAFSRRQMLQPEVLNLNEVIQGLSKSLSRLIGEHIELDIACDAARPNVEVDRHQIEQVILNLAVNARDAIKEHGTITISTQNAMDQLGRSQLLIRVRDDGSGIEPAVMKRMFEPFYTTKEVGKGTGLGLATVHGIVEQSGGRISVESTVGRGSMFSVHLPTVNAIQLSARPKLDMLVEGGNETILLVEDENAVRAISHRMLKLLGYTVIEARHGRDALTLASDKNVHIDLLVTDVIMPEMGGRELATTLREQRPGLPVLYMSGYTDDELLRRGILEPGVRLMRKPFTKKDLARVVRALLNGAEATPAETIGGRTAEFAVAATR